MNTHSLLSEVGVAVAMMVAFIATAAQANADEYDGPFTMPAESAPASVVAASTGAAGFRDLIPRIEDAIHRLGYPKDVAKNLVELTRGWDWDAIMSSTLPEQRATLRDTTPNQQMTAFLARNIKAAFTFQSGADDLAKALTGRTANCQAYAQLFYVLGTSAGLEVEVLQVSEMVDWNTGKSAGAHPDGGHVACLAELENGKVAIVEPTGNWVNEPFVFRDTYAQAGNFFELKEVPDPWHPYNPLRLYPRIRIQPDGGIAASRMNSDGNRLADQVKAIKLYEKAMALDPSNSFSYQNRGTSYKILGQLDKAAADVTMAIALDPKWGVLYHGRGTVHYMKGQYDRAVADCDKAIALNNHKKELALWGRT
jgi:tetratricopeptide (TPR) repeat protein